MATRSITSSVNIKGRRQVQAFVNALEKAEAKQGKTVELKRELRTVDMGELRKIYPLIKA